MGAFVKALLISGLITGGLFALVWAAVPLIMFLIITGISYVIIKENQQARRNVQHRR